MNHEVIVAGSTWKEDEEVLSAFLKRVRRKKIIIAPHEISEENTSRLQKLFPESVLISACNGPIPVSSNVLIINTIGMLSRIYRWSTVSYIGGGFNKAGIHNVLEAAVYGKVTVFGPHFNRSGEAEALVAKKAAFTFSDTDEFEALMTKLLNTPELRKSGESVAERFVIDGLGATNIILDHMRTLTILKDLTANKYFFHVH